jgi:hypothetical protein
MLAPFCKLVTPAEVDASIVWDAENIAKMAIPAHFCFCKKWGHACGLRIEKKELRKKNQAKERSGRTGLE